MAHLVLGIGYTESEYESVRRTWRQHGVDFHFASSTDEAVQLLPLEDYVCITIFTDRIYGVQYEQLQGIKAVPIVLLSHDCSIVRQAEYLQRGIVEFVLNEAQWQDAQQSGNDVVQYYFDLPNKVRKSLTVMTTEDMFFCLEHRSVEVRGQYIDLTPKEFDILALLITHPRQVFPFSVIAELIWKEYGDYYSQKNLANYMSSIRKKLKVQQDVPNYIISIHGIGYKFDVG